MLHCGGEHIAREELKELRTPEGTRTHQPIPHYDLVDIVTRNIANTGLQIVDEQHGISHDGDRYFGLLNLQNGCEQPDYGLAIGLRNSHDKRFPAGLCVGSRVFVCDNLAFSNEIVLARKHTRHIMRDLPRVVFQAMGKLGEAKRNQDRRILAYKNTPINDPQAHDLLIKSVDAKVIPVSRIADVLKEWRTPQHRDFQERTAWSLFNGFTEVGKRYDTADLAQRTIRLHGLMDVACGVGG
jgi:hypothetical protein